MTKIQIIDEESLQNIAQFHRDRAKELIEKATQLCDDPLYHPNSKAAVLSEVGNMLKRAHRHEEIAKAIPEYQRAVSEFKEFVEQKKSEKLCESCPYQAQSSVEDVEFISLPPPQQHQTGTEEG